ncbi:DUF3313 family protein [Halioglobus maricola]|uniref:DUF3313 family protein n=1 Tax=Halioglobus maricola TaxID=2601894 RepID=A0A5P9NMB6_9GAMM|nr:DUF3313 family protein [Halioglobus maricola]QFU76404.1 DUF3313 family protein [Halioglobus maricola]
MLNRFFLSAATLALVSACSGTPPTVQTGEDAEVIGDNLHRVDNSRADAAYIDPQADFSKYTKILLRPLGVDNVEIVQPDRTTSAVNRRDWELTDKDRESLQQIYHDAMVKQLQEKGDFEIVAAPADDVLEIGAIITGIAPSAAKDDGQSRTVGRSYVVTEGAGAIAVAVAFGDSETGEILALIKDSRTSSTHWGLNNSVSNRADVQRVFTSWAMQINTSLAKITGKTE